MCIRDRVSGAASAGRGIKTGIKKLSGGRYGEGLRKICDGSGTGKPEDIRRRVMREKILTIMEKNSRIDLADLAALLGESEIAVANEIADMEKENIICGYHTMINWDKTGEMCIRDRPGGDGGPQPVRGAAGFR